VSLPLPVPIVATSSNCGARRRLEHGGNGTTVGSVERRGLSVREAVAADLPATARIIADEGEGTEEEWVVRFAEVLADTNRLFLVAEVDGRVVGFGQARLVQRSTSEHPDVAPDGWYLSGVTVASRHRRCGVALALTKARLDRLGDVAVHYACEAENTATIALHERLGFVPAGTIDVPGRRHPLLLFRRGPQNDN
jgi:ribosomal protein S18 acetylase RimI-like enzyme